MDLKKIYTVISVTLGIILLYSLFWFLKAQVEDKIQFKYNWSYFISYLPLFTGLTGLVIFVASSFKQSGLLRVYMCIIITSFPFWAWGYINILTSDSFAKMKLNVSWSFYLGIFLSAMQVICCVTGLWYLSKTRVPKFTYTSIGSETIAEFSPAPGILRFLNRLTDVIIIIFLIYINVIANRYFKSVFRHSSFFNNEGALLLIEVLFVLYYYLVLEGIFNTSAGKCATLTIIVNEQAQRPNFGQILGRTFCRLIPFEAFSFLGASARGWHDSIPGTYVIESVDKDSPALTTIELDAEKTTD